MVTCPRAQVSVGCSQTENDAYMLFSYFTRETFLLPLPTQHWCSWWRMTPLQPMRATDNGIETVRARATPVCGVTDIAILVRLNSGFLAMHYLSEILCLWIPVRAGSVNVSPISYSGQETESICGTKHHDSNRSNRITLNQSGVAVSQL